MSAVDPLAQTPDGSPVGDAGALVASVPPSIATSVSSGG
jgi:hypothetical protein